MNFTDLNSQVEDIKLYNYLGKIISQKEIQNQNISQKIDTSGHPSGVYFLSINLVDGSKITKKVIKK